MNEWESDEKLARAADLPGLDDALRAELLAATSRVVRARRYRRVALQFAAVALAFISGMLTMAQWPSTSSSTSTSPTTMASEPAPNPGNEESPPAAPLFADPEALARAFDAASDEEKLRLLRGAGDYELNDRGDVRTALAYYDQWVRLADATARKQYDENDTWLLASLKHGD